MRCFAAILLPERNAPATPIAFHLRQCSRAFQFHEQQTSLARDRRTQAQCRSRIAGTRFFRRHSRRAQQSTGPETQQCEPDSPLLNQTQDAPFSRCCRIIATRGSTFANCARPSFDPRMALSDNKNRSGFCAFSRSSLRKGRTLANIKYSSPQNAGSKNSFSLTTPFTRKDVAIPQ